MKFDSEGELIKLQSGRFKMTKEKAIAEITRIVNGFDGAIVQIDAEHADDFSEIKIEDGSGFVGGVEGTFMSEHMGNYNWPTARGIAEAVADYVYDEGASIVGVGYTD